MDTNTIEIDLTRQVEELKRKLQQTMSELDRLKKKEDIAKQVFDKIPIDIFIKDPSDSFKYLYCNKSFIDSQGSGLSVVGKDDYEVFSNPQDAAYLRNDDIKVLSNGKKFTYIESYTNKDGETGIILVFKEPLVLEGYIQPLLLGTSIDLSNVPDLSQSLLKKFEDVDKVSKTQTVKMANLRHEIKTPLNAIVGFTHLLNDSSMKLSDDERENFIRLINSNTELLQSIVTEILNKPNENKVNEFHRKDIDLETTLRDVYSVYQPKFNNSSVEFVYKNAGRSVTVFCDESKLLQIVYNLLNNAIKYTSEGSITLGYEYNDDKSVKIYVADTGKGVAKENLEKLFNRFEKLGSTKEGYGLGLSIVKTIAEGAGGHCGVESELGKGSYFWVELPLRCRTKII